MRLRQLSPTLVYYVKRFAETLRHRLEGVRRPPPVCPGRQEQALLSLAGSANPLSDCNWLTKMKKSRLAMRPTGRGRLWLQTGSSSPPSELMELQRRPVEDRTNRCTCLLVSASSMFSSTATTATTMVVAATRED